MKRVLLFPVLVCVGCRSTVSGKLLEIDDLEILKITQTSAEILVPLSVSDQVIISKISELPGKSVEEIRTLEIGSGSGALE